MPMNGMFSDGFGVELPSFQDANKSQSPTFSREQSEGCKAVLDQQIQPLAPILHFLFGVSLN